MRDLIRTVRFAPYLPGKGPRFTLRLYDLSRTDSMGKSILGYRLTARENGKTTVIFDGSDFHCSPLDAIDSDSAVENIMGFLTLRPGDTDRECFDDYTPEQLAYCSDHAETLGA